MVKFMRWLIALLSKLKALVYDSYTGLRKRRLVLIASVVAAVTVAAIVVGTLPSSGSPSDGISAGTDSGTDGETPGVVVPGGEDGNTFMPNDRYTPATPNHKPTVAPDKPDVEQQGAKDIQSSGGVSEDTAPADVPYPDTNIYSQVSNKQELRTVISNKVAKINNDYLLYMDAVLVHGSDWKTFASDAILHLSDATLMGEYVRESFSGGAIAAWNALEPVMVKYREELYLCESEIDFRSVAAGETRRGAIELTAAFLAAPKN
ncbi:hypothetical protein FACS1894208_01030 [Clostridia bacterium]|nr:hypothetical protein FACS1894208_01030 [Clostridia bacterium]